MMPIRTAVPSGGVATLQQVREAVRASGMEDDDDLLLDLLAAQTRRYEDFTGRVMLPTGFEARFAHGCRMLRLQVSPIREITSIICLDAAGAEVAIEDDNWIVLDGDRDWTVMLMSDAVLPDSGSQPLPLRVRFTAGYLSAAEWPVSNFSPRLAPDPADRRHILLMVQWAYDRDDQMPEDQMRKIMGHRRIFR